MGKVRINSALPWIALAVVALVAFVGWKVTQRPEPLTVTAGPPLRALPQTPELPDSDTASDTLKQIRADVTQEKDRITTNQVSVRDVEAKVEEVEAAAEKRVADLQADFDAKLAQQASQTEAATQEQTAGLTAQVARLEEMLSGFDAPVATLPIGGSNKAPERTSESISDGMGDDLPSGFGYEASEPKGDYIWLTPLEADGQGSTDEAGLGGSLLPSPASFDVNALADDLITPIQDTVDDEVGLGPEPIPYFTIPNLSTLASSTGLTAMIGKVPVSGQVRDPIGFRVLVGRENLAASGLRVPEDIVSMVFEGSAIGQWTLGCVEGYLHTATFVFADGTIRTVSTLNDGASDSGDGTQRLGYIADRFGIPCVSGERVSNSRSYLAAQVALGAAAGAAEAAAASQTTQVVGLGSGTIGSAVTGDQGQFIAGRAAASGLTNAQAYLAERVPDAVDIVFVAPGQELSILIQREIAIDYEPSGRRMEYATYANGATRRELD